MKEGATKIEPRSSEIRPKGKGSLVTAQGRLELTKPHESVAQVVFSLRRVWQCFHS